MSSQTRSTRRQFIHDASMTSIAGLLAREGSALGTTAADRWQVRNRRNHVLSSDDSWGWFCGVKQPLGAHKKGWSIHQITRHLSESKLAAAPDNIFWVDENSQTSGIAQNRSGPKDIFSFRLMAAKSGGATSTFVK